MNWQLKFRNDSNTMWFVFHTPYRIKRSAMWPMDSDVSAWDSHHVLSVMHGVDFSTPYRNRKFSVWMRELLQACGWTIQQ